jgi:hypothetical protein
MDTWIGQKPGQAGEPPPEGRDDPLRAARERGRAVRQELLQREGGTWTAEQVASYVGVTLDVIEGSRRAGSLIGLRTDRPGHVYPVWQFDRHRVLAGLEETLAALTVHDPWMQAAYFLSSDPRLNGARPLDELRQGHLDAVRRAASGYGEHGAA